MNAGPRTVLLATLLAVIGAAPAFGQAAAHLREPRLGRLAGARVSVGGRRVRVTRRAGRLTARIDLRRRPAGRVIVRIVARTRDGRTLRSTRPTACAVGAPRGAEPRPGRRGAPRW